MTESFHHPGGVLVEFKLHDRATPTLRQAAEYARRLGLTLSSGARPSATHKEDPMPPKNPYDRRGGGVPRGRGRDGHAARPGDVVELEAGRALYDPAAQRLEMADEVDTPRLTLRDLEELVAAKVRRARRDGDDAAYARDRAEMLEARRAAWEEGRQAGADDARRALLEEIDRQVGGEVHDLHAWAVKVLDADPKTKAGREATTKAQMMMLAKAAAALTDSLVTKHHDGFAVELPF